MEDPVLEEPPKNRLPAVPMEERETHRWVIPASYRAGMRVEGLVFANREMVQDIQHDNSAQQVANVATLPGIVRASLGMPDIHWGYGFPIGGVAAIDADEGVVSPGGVGFDINCGVRLIRTDLSLKDVQGKLKELVDAMFRFVPSGVGGRGALNARASIDEVLEGGAKWVVEQGLGWTKDLERLEEGGRMKGATPETVSVRAKQRGGPQLGSLGSGNHFGEIQVVEQVVDAERAKAFGLSRRDGICIMLHTGSRGLGHQVCSDYLQTLATKGGGWGIELPDRQLACAPMRTREAEHYLGAMMAAANFAWANRELLTHQVRLAFQEVLGRSAEELGMDVVYDLSHNMAKVEEHVVEGHRRRLVVHRKGATRAFGPDHPDVPPLYRPHGQPILVPGDMGTGSWVLAGTSRAMAESFGSCCHGAGRRLSRAASNRKFSHADVVRELREKGVHLRSLTHKGVTEEAPGAYKNVDDVVNVVDAVGIGRKVVRLRPLGVIKG